MDEDTKIWIANKFPLINERQLRLISEEAYDRGHSSGQEEVNSYAKGIAYFVNAILDENYKTF